MQNKYFKSAIISSVIAVMTGVLFFGISVTLGAPTYQPPGTDVKPTFNGATFTGDIDFQNGAIKNSTGNNLGVVNIQDHVVVNGDLGLSGSVSANKNVTVGFVNNPPSNTNGILEVINKIINPVLNAKVKIDDGLDVTGNVSNSIGDVTIDDNLKINNELNVGQNAVFNDEVEMSGTLILRGSTQIWDDGKGYVFSVSTPMEVAGMISNPNANVSIDDGLDVTGGLGVGGNIFNKDLDVLGLTDNLSVLGPAYPGASKGIMIDGKNGTIAGLPGTFKLLGNVTADSFKTVLFESTDDAKFNKNINVTGKVTSAGGFGTYTFRESGFVLVPKGGTNHAYVTLACNAGEVAVSCFSNAFSKNTGNDFWTNETYDDVILTALYPWTTKCEANYKNTSAVTDKYIKVGAMCFNPKI